MRACYPVDLNELALTASILLVCKALCHLPGKAVSSVWLYTTAALLVQACPHDADCNVPGALRLRGPLVEHALKGALALVLQRHDALRTHISTSHAGGAPVQVWPSL